MLFLYQKTFIYQGMNCIFELSSFSHIPKGKYYLLACSIEKKLSPLRYFVLDDCLRGKADHLLQFPKDSAKEIDIYLREALPEDPPISINLPKLLSDTFKLRNP
ncbi:hypothetical protein [Tetragenococcus halophilus]|uniref:hypothetical protein n=1 Tax=Tetragenococcus halophilus TaxID=51669 RepID=UPI00157F8412|nr:hypothetical protein [Tetragenococcus halophilus]